MVDAVMVLPKVL
jgi:hypothetical protein